MADRLIDLSKEGSIGINNDTAFASLGYSLDARAEFCNGIRLQFEVEAAANAGISAHVAEFFKVLIEIETGLAVGIQLSAQLSPRLMDEIGLTAAAQAYLKAYIRARLELRLTLEKIIRNVSAKSSSVELRLFKKFIERLEIGVGVEANAQIGLTAAAELLCNGRLIEEENKKAGFDFRVNAEAAFMFGAGVDFFAMARFDSITLFFKDAKDILLEELEEKIDDGVFASAAQKTLVFSIWSTALDTIIASSLPEITKKRNSFTATLNDFVFRLVFDQLCNFYKQFLDTQIGKLSEWIGPGENLTKDDLTKIWLWLDALEKGWDEKQTFFELALPLSSLIKIVEKLGYPEAAMLNNILTHLYALGYLIDKPNRGTWKNLPPVVQENFREVTGRSITTISSEADAFDYLEKSCLDSFLATQLLSGNGTDELSTLLNLLESKNISVSYLISLLTSDRNAEAEKLLLETGIDLLDTLVGDTLFPAINNLVNTQWPGRTDIGDELLSSLMNDLLSAYRSIFIGFFKKVFSGEGTKKDTEHLTVLANKFLLNTLSKNAGMLVKELLLHSTQSITDSIDDCTQKLRGGSLNRMADNLQKKAEEGINASLPVPIPQEYFQHVRDKLQDATTDFLLDIMRIARTSMGRDTWTTSRINHISTGMQYVLFQPESNHLSFQHLSPGQVAAKIADLDNCSFLPNISKDILVNLLKSMQAIGWQQLKSFLLEMPVAVGIYLLKLLKILFLDSIIEVLQELWEGIKNLLKKLGELIEELGRLLRELAEKIAAAAAKIAAAIGELFSKVGQAIEDFFSRLFNSLDFFDMNWLENFLDSLWGILGGDTAEEKARKVLEALKQKARTNLQNSNMRQAMEAAAKGNTFDGVFFRNYLNTYIVDDSIRSSLNKMKFRSGNAVNEAWGEASRRFHNTVAELEINSLGYWSSQRIHDLRSEELNSVRVRMDNANRSAQLLTGMDNRAIRVNSPLTINIPANDIPIYGKWLYLDVDFGSLDIGTVIRNQLSLPAEKLVTPDGELSTYEWKREIRYAEAIENICPVQVKILLNGKEIDLKSCKIKGNRISGHVATEWLQHGPNDLFVLVLTPPEYAHKSFQQHIRFYCDHRNTKRRSNAIYIDPIESVINTRGDDHEDAQRSDAHDRETVVIKNSGDEELIMDGWKLSDAAGHQLVFGPHTWVKPGQKLQIVVGEATPGFVNWKEYYNGQLTAILNNNGEFLKLEDTNGKVVSHIYTGNPLLNKQIHFISFR